MLFDDLFESVIRMPAAPAAPKAPSLPKITKTSAVAKKSKPLTLSQQVAEQLQSVKTREDVQKFKLFLDQIIAENTTVTESVQSVRKQLLEQATKLAAIRRRQYN
jgi:hypothetical protein